MTKVLDKELASIEASLPNLDNLRSLIEQKTTQKKEMEAAVAR